MNCAIGRCYHKFLLLHNDFHIARAVHPQWMTYFHSQQKDSEEEVEEVIRNILQLQGKVILLGANNVEKNKFINDNVITCR